MVIRLSSTTAEDSPAVRRVAGQPVELPGEYTEYVLAFEQLLSEELLSWCQQQVLARRAGAYEFIDLLAFLLAFFTATAADRTLGEFAADSREVGPELAAVAGRCRWMSQASVSRALQSVDEQLATEACDRLLQASSAFCLPSPLVHDAGYRDGEQNPWWVLHWDTTVTPMRQRALPQDEELPPPIRLSNGLAAAGYSGRKRSDVQVSRSILQESCSATWLHLDLQPGNGSLSEQMESTADAAARFVQDDPMRKARTVVVADGVGGGVVQVRHVYQRGLHVLTRWAQYGVLDEPGCRALVQQDQGWAPVEDSRSGPRRQARDLGRVTLAEQVPCRVIVSRFRADGKGRGAGKTIDNWHYELFVTTLAEDVWAAADAVTLYYGRTAIENRFAAEDREFGLDRIFSYSGPGQQLACAVAMAVWNLRCAGGVAAVSQEVTRKPMQPRPPAPLPDASGELQMPQGPDDVQPDSSDEFDEMSPHSVCAGDPSTSASDFDAVCRQATSDWATCHPGWSVDSSTGALCCPAGRTLNCSSIRSMPGGDALRYRARASDCSRCPLRLVCSPNARAERFRREVNIALPVAAPPELRSASTPAMDPPRPQRIAPAATHVPAPAWVPEAPILKPAVLRKMTRNKLRLLTITVLTPIYKASIEEQEEHLSEDSADRQRRRMTISQRVAQNAHPDLAAVHVAATASADTAQWIHRFTALARSG
jgi:hypothetical protein